MIPFKTLIKKSLDLRQDFANEQVPFEQAMGSVLAQNVMADRKFPFLLIGLTKTELAY